MKRFFLALALLSSMFFLGCLSVDLGYAPNEEVSVKKVTEDERYPVTYSVEFENPRTDILFAPDLKGLKERVEEALKETNLFSEITYASEPQDDTYHLKFQFQMWCIPMEESIACGMVAGMTLLLVPVWEECALDGKVFAYYKGQPVFSAAAGEKLRHFTWLPFIPGALFCNLPIVFPMVEKGVVNNMINDFAAEHERRYLSK